MMMTANDVYDSLDRVYKYGCTYNKDEIIYSGINEIIYSGIYGVDKHVPYPELTFRSSVDCNDYIQH